MFDHSIKVLDLKAFSFYQHPLNYLFYFKCCNSILVSRYYFFDGHNAGVTIIRHKFDIVFHTSLGKIHWLA